MFHFEAPRRVLSLVKRCEPDDLLDKLIGLSLSPGYQSNHLRILTLIQVALVHAKGMRKASITDLAALLNGLWDHPSRQNEDPAEDVFVSSVSTSSGAYMIFNGLYPAADFNLQRMLEAVLSQDFFAHDHLTNECEALLILSDAIAQRCDFRANYFEESQQWRKDWPTQLPPLVRKGRSTRFSADELHAFGMSWESLEPFILDDVGGLLDDPYGYTALGRRPLLLDGDGVFLPIPSLVSPALRLHLAHAIAKGEVPQSAISHFQDNQLGRWLMCDFPARGARPLQEKEIEAPATAFELPGDYAHATLSFDADKLAHLVVIGADWSRPPARSVQQARPAGSEFERGLAAHLHASFDTLSAKSGSERGLTLLVQDSPGWGLNFDLGDDLSDDWFVVGLTPFQLSMLLADPTFSLLDMWKMLREARRISGLGIAFMAWPDMLNYWSIWRHFGDRFWPRDVDLRQFGAFLPDTSKIQGHVAAIRALRDTHAAPYVTGEWRRVERWADADAPTVEYTKPVYIDPLRLVSGELHSVVEIKHGKWWVISPRPPSDPEDRQYLYLLWQGATEWVRLLARCAEEYVGKSSGVIEIRLLPVPSSITDAPRRIEYKLAKNLAVMNVFFPPNFAEELATVDNAGEVKLVTALATAITKALGVDVDDVTLNAWVSEVTRDPALKMMHMTASTDIGPSVDLVTERLPFRCLQDPDLASVSLHLLDALALVPESGVTPSTKRVETTAAATKILHAVVDIRWQRCRVLLRQLDRVKLLLLIMRLIEALHRRRAEMERSTLARSRLYGRGPDVDEWEKQTIGKRDSTFRAYRVVAEMAVCESPLIGGREPGISDVDTLTAELHFLIKAADESDAINSGLVAPGLGFLPNGSLKVRDGGAQGFMRAYLTACLGESLAMDVDNYPSLYEEPPASGLAEDNLDASSEEAFDQAFVDEFGLSLLEALSVSVALQEIALDEKSDVVRMSRSELEVRLTQGARSIAPPNFRKFLLAFGLTSRSAWDRPPPGFSTADIWPWIFERRLSLMLRPVMIASNDPDPLVMFGVRQVDMGIRYASILLETGNWPKDKLSSATAKAYVDREINRRGDAFEEEVAKLVATAEWRAIPPRR